MHGARGGGGTGRDREKQCMNISLGYSQHNKHWESGISCRILSKLFIKKQAVTV